MTEKHYAPNEMIFREGEESHFACLLISGKVEILKSADHGEIRLAVLEPGAPFGEMGLFDHTERSASARALEPTVLDIIDGTAFTEMLSQCPPRLLPLIHVMLERLRATTARVTKTEQATAVLTTDITEVIVAPASAAIENQLKPTAVPVAQLPYRIGGYAEDGEPSHFDHNHLYLASEGPPLVISKNHCEIDVIDGGIYVVDRGSRFGTVVNNLPIGRGRGQYKAALVKGENLISLGGRQSPYQLHVTCK